MNKTQLWYFDICDKTFNFINKSKHFNSKTHLHKKECCMVVKEYEFSKPEKDEVSYALNDTIKDCENKYFLSFENRCAYDIKFTNMENNEEVISTIIIGYMKFKSQFYGLKKSKIS